MCFLVKVVVVLNRLGCGWMISLIGSFVIIVVKCFLVLKCVEKLDLRIVFLICRFRLLVMMMFVVFCVNV